MSFRRTSIAVVGFFSTSWGSCVWGGIVLCKWMFCTYEINCTVTFWGVRPTAWTSLGSASKHRDSCCCSEGARLSLHAFSNSAFISADPLGHIWVSHWMGYWLSVGFSHVTWWQTDRWFEVHSLMTTPSYLIVTYVERGEGSHESRFKGVLSDLVCTTRDGFNGPPCVRQPSHMMSARTQNNTLPFRYLRLTDWPWQDGIGISQQAGLPRPVDGFLCWEKSDKTGNVNRRERRWI